MLAHTCVMCSGVLVRGWPHCWSWMRANISIPTYSTVQNVYIDIQYSIYTDIQYSIYTDIQYSIILTYSTVYTLTYSTVYILTYSTV